MYNTTRPNVHSTTFVSSSPPEDQTLLQNGSNSGFATLDDVVESGRSAMTDGQREVVPEYSILSGRANMNTEEHLQGEKKKILSGITGFGCQEGEAKRYHDHTMTASAKDAFEEMQDNKAIPRNKTDLEENTGMETALPAQAERRCAESREKKFGQVLAGTSVTMTRPLAQLAESVEIEKKRLDEFEKDLERAITARLEAQSLSTPCTARILEARLIETDLDIAAIQSAFKMRQRLVERQAKLARVGVGLHDRSALNAQAAEHERRELEAGKRHTMSMVDGEGKEKCKKEEQARREFQEVTQTTQESDRDLISLLADNDRDFATAHGVIRNGRTLSEMGEDLELIDTRVARRNWQIVNAYLSDSTVDSRKGDRPSCDDYQKNSDETRRLRLMSYRHLREYMKLNGTAAARSLLQALSKLSMCTSSHMRLKNALISCIQQHDAETGSTYECPRPGRVPPFGPTPVSPEVYSMHYLPRHSTNDPMCSYTFGSTLFPPTQRSHASEHMRETPSVSRTPDFYARTSRMPSPMLGVQGNSVPRHAMQMDLVKPQSFLRPVQSHSSPIAHRMTYSDQHMQVKVEDKRDEELERRAELLGGFPSGPMNVAPDPDEGNYIVNHSPAQPDPEQAVDEGMQVKKGEGKNQEVMQKTELPGALPSSRIDSGAFLCDPKWGLHGVIDPVDEIDQEQVVTSELLAESTQLDRILAQPPHPDIINGTTRLLIFVILTHTTLWFYTYWKLSQQIYLAPTLVFIGFRVLMESLNLYQRMHQFWMCEDPKSIALPIVSSRWVTYVSTILLTTWYGPFCALCTVWIIPLILKLPGWCTKGCVSSEKWLPRRIRLMHGPFPERTTDHRRTLRVASFGINTNRFTLLISWLRLLDIIYYALTYVALFSRRESWLAKGLALLISMYLRSGLYPQPRQLGEADTIFHLCQREFDCTRESGRIRCPSLTECFAQQYTAFREGCRRYSHLLEFMSVAAILMVCWTILFTLILL